MSLNFGDGLFPPRGEINAQFDFQELLSQQGFVNFFIGNYYDDSGTEANLLSSNTFLPINQTIDETRNLTDPESTTDVVEFSEDFDAIINAPQTISGKGTIRLYRKGEVVVSSHGAGEETTIISHVKVDLIRVRDAIETIIASSSTPTQTLFANGVETVTFEKYETIELDCTKTRLNKGDTLRTTVEWISDSVENDHAVNTTYQTIVGTDPEDRLKIAINYAKPGAENELFQYAKSKQFKITIPFELID